MTDWRDHILQHFTQPIHRLTLVADLDGLLLEETLQATIRERGFDLLFYDDVVNFRYRYESDYRRQWDQGQVTSLVVILRTTAATLDHLPYDLLQTGHRLRFSLIDLFPGLSYPIVKALNVVHLPALYEAYQAYHGPALGDQNTKAFILEHVFATYADRVKTALDLLKLLLLRHTRADQVPELFDDYLAAQIASRVKLLHWPVRELLRTPAEFFAVLQQAWLDYLAAQQSPAVIREYQENYKTIVSLPLDSPEIKVYLTGLFAEGKLKPVLLPKHWHIVETWTKVGIVTATSRPENLHVDHLLTHIATNLPASNSPYRAWLHVAEHWSELTVLFYRHFVQLSEQQRADFETLHYRIESQFADWLQDRYHTLHNQPYHSTPVMGHHIPGFLAAHRRRGPGLSRLALIVVDGLALDQWRVIRQVWLEEDRPWTIQESAIFTWIPTLTSIARQAIFAGQPPQLFPDTWHITNAEETRWQKFWQEHGLTKSAVGYARNLGVRPLDLPPATPAGSLAPNTQAYLEVDVLKLIEDRRYEVIGLVVNTVDNICHGMQLGTGGMHQQVRQWMTQQPYLTQLIVKLLTDGFEIFLTADHGNITARGMGRPKEGVLVETRGERARIYTDPAFLALARQQSPEAIPWSNVGLPAELSVLLAPNLQAFVEAGAQVVCHGGAALEEVIVPFVKITKKDTE